MVFQKTPSGHIKVPIRLIGKIVFPKSIPSSLVTGVTGVSDLEFLEQLSEDLRLFEITGSSTTVSQIVSITPQTGSTFFFLAATIQNTQTVNTLDCSIINDGTTREAVTLQALEFYDFAIPMDRLVGNSIKSFSINQLDDLPGSTNATLWGWVENTEKIP